MNAPDGELRRIFEACAWTDKVEGGQPPRPEETVYRFGEEEAEVARVFLLGRGAAVLTQQTVVVARSLCLCPDEHGAWTLFVREVEKPGFAASLHGMAAAFAGLMDVSRLGTPAGAKGRKA